MQNAFKPSFYYSQYVLHNQLPIWELKV